LRPDTKLPSQKDLGGRLLDDAYRNVKEKVDAWLGHDRYGCITSDLLSDSWSNIKNEAVINYMFVSEDTNLFLESKQTGEFSHTATYLASNLSRVIEGIAKGHVAGAIMDNISAIKAAWLILKEGHPELFFQGCVAHGLHLLVKDIFAATKARRGRVVADYPDQYPFEYLLVFTMKCKAIVKFFHNHHAPKAQLKKALIAAKLRMPVQMAPTRWGSVRDMAETLLSAKEILLQIVTGRDFVLTGRGTQKDEQQAILNTVSDDMFVPHLRKTLQILDPIDAAIKYYQSDSVPISEVFRTFSFKLPAAIQKMDLVDQEKTYLVNLVKHRFTFMYGDAHAIAYTLDPRYLAVEMTPEQRTSAEELIFNSPKCCRGLE
jgi:hypothetical protein